MSHDISMGASGFTAADYNRQTLVDATTITGAYTPDFKTVDGTNPVTGIIFQGTLAAGVTFNQPINAPVTEQCFYRFENPGVETPTFSGYKNITKLPAWEAGKGVHYQIQRLINDEYMLTGAIDGGGIIAATGFPDLPAINTEVAFRQHATLGQTYLQYWEGFLTIAVQELAGVSAGSIQNMISYGGDIQPSVQSGNDVQRWPIPYVWSDPLLSIGCQLNNGTIRLIAGQTAVNQTGAFKFWAEYTL
jgi:hypothetical protein